jgi:uncharacterized Zn-finger protein
MGAKKYNCEICPTSFTERGSLKRHIAKVHEKKNSFECYICNKKFAMVADMNQHIKLRHPEGKKVLNC